MGRQISTLTLVDCEKCILREARDGFGDLPEYYPCPRDQAIEASRRVGDAGVHGAAGVGDAAVSAPHRPFQGTRPV